MAAAVLALYPTDRDSHCKSPETADFSYITERVY